MNTQAQQTHAAKAGYLGDHSMYLPSLELPSPSSPSHVTDKLALSPSQAATRVTRRMMPQDGATAVDATCLSPSKGRGLRRVFAPKASAAHFSPTLLRGHQLSVAHTSDPWTEVRTEVRGGRSMSQPMGRPPAHAMFHASSVVPAVGMSP